MCLGVPERVNSLPLVEGREVVAKKALNSTCKSTVFTASWNGNLVAAKRLKESLEDVETKKSALDEMKNEIGIFRRISHPCLVKLLGANVDVAGPIMLMELLENQDVETLACNMQQKLQYFPTQAQPVNICSVLSLWWLGGARQEK